MEWEMWFTMRRDACVEEAMRNTDCQAFSTSNDGLNLCDAVHGPICRSGLLLINSALKYRSIVMMFLTQLLLGLVDVVEEKAEDFFAFFTDDLCTLMIFLLK
jgi:hypothetical protein